MKFEKGQRVWYWFQHQTDGPVPAVLTTYVKHIISLTLVGPNCEIELLNRDCHRFIIVPESNLYTHDEMNLMRAVGVI